MLPEGSVPSLASDLGRLLQSFGILVAAAPPDVILAYAYFTGDRVSAVPDSSGGLSPKPQTGEFPERRPRLHGTVRQSHLHPGQPLIAAPVSRQPLAKVLANCVLSNTDNGNSVEASPSAACCLRAHGAT